MKDKTFCDAIVQKNLYSTRYRLRNHLEFTFGKINLESTRLLDVGGGSGLLSLYCGYRGGSAVCLEPEAAGSTRGISAVFNNIANLLNIEKRVQMLAVPLDDYIPDGKFDLIILANSINHIDEDSCVSLAYSESSRARYSTIFRRLNQMLLPGGRIILLDCTNRNFFNDLGCKSPIMPTIEWGKHQSPNLWGRLMTESGLHLVRLQWSAPNMLGWWGRMALGNRLAAYFTFSHFRLEAQRQDA